MIPFHRPAIGDAERRAVVAALDSGWLSMGPRVRDFEDAFGTAVRAQEAVAVSSATAGLTIALEGRKRVAVPTYTFAACGAAVLHAGAKLVLVDVGEDYLIADVPDRCDAVMPVHFAGRRARVEWGGRLVVEDAAHCVPGPLGGDVAVYSFYATKPLTTGEGGMIVTHSPEIADRARIMRLHGMSAGAWDRYAGGSWRYSVEAAGWKANMTDPAAAMGMVQLLRQGELLAARTRIAAQYDAAFVDTPVQVPPTSESWHLYVVRVPDRDRVADALAARGIGTSVHFIPLHLHPYYQSLGWRPGDFPVAERLYAESLSLPIWPGMTEGQVAEVAEAVLGALGVPA